MNEEIKILLNDIDKIRGDVGVFIGSAYLEGIMKMVDEATDNVNDEAKKKKKDEVLKATLSVYQDKYVLVTDTGSGIPVFIHKTTNEPVIFSIFEKISAGSKLKTIENKSTKTGGTHGMGMTAVNALSEHMVMLSWRDNKLHKAEWRQGVRQHQEGCDEYGLIRYEEPSARLFEDDRLEEAKNKLIAQPSGSVVMFRPDETIMKFEERENKNLFYDIDYLHARIEDYMLFNPNIEFTFKWYDIEHDTYEEKEYVQSDYSLEAKFKSLDGEYTSCILENPETNTVINIHINTDASSRIHLGSVNGLKVMLGKHMGGFLESITKGLIAYLGPLYEPEIWSIQTIAVQNSLSFGVSVEMFDPEFDSQAKKALESNEVYTLLHSKLLKEIDQEWFNRYAESYKREYLSMLDYSKSKKQKKNKELTKEEKLKANSEFMDCLSKDKTKTKLFLAEGVSPLNAICAGRDRDYHAVMEFGGKIKNIEKDEELPLAIRKMLEKIATDKYGYIIGVPDADNNGRHITNHLLALFYRYCPDLIEQGRILIGIPPRYRMVYKSATLYAVDDEDRQRIIDEKGNPMQTVQFEGLASMQPHEIAHFLEEGTFVQPVIDEDTEDALKIMMGKSVTARQELITDRFAAKGFLEKYKISGTRKYTVSDEIENEIASFIGAGVSED